MNDRIRSHLSVWIFVCLLVVGPTFVIADEPGVFQVGAARVDITPDYPIRLNGFAVRKTESEGVSQRIFARALAISDGEAPPLVLLTVDSLGVRLPMVDALAATLLREAQIPRENVALTFTHTHSAPKVNGASDNIFAEPISAEHQQHIDRYTDQLAASLESVALRAIQQRRPATLRWGIGKVQFSKNRRTPGGPVDHALPVMLVEDVASRKVRAVYVSYACHAVTLSFNRVDGDWPGYAAQMLERHYPDAIGLVAIGAGSDMNPISGVTGDKVDVAQRQGAEIADEVRRLVKEGPLQPLSAPLRAVYKTIPVQLDRIPTRDELQAMIDAGGPAGYNASTQLARLDRGEQLLTAIRYPVQTWSWGEDLCMVFLAGEVCVDYSLRLKRQFDRNRFWLNGYSNDFCAYIPSERLLKEGGYGGGAEIPYFALPAKLRSGVEQQIVDEVQRQVPESFLTPPGTQGLPPLSPAMSLRQMKTHDHLRVELVAAEPLVADPVAIDFGADGRLWVAEMSDYGRGVYEEFPGTGRVRWLVDHDGDGRFDTAQTFLDGLRFPTDVKCWRDGLLICDAPNVLFARDTDGDRVADQVETLLSGFEVRNAQARVNSLRWGLDNYLYGACGLFGGEITSHRTGEKVSATSRDFRFDPDSGFFEAASGRTQQGRCRNDWGDWFGCSNGTLIKFFPTDDRMYRNPLVRPPPSEAAVATGKGADELRIDHPLVRFELSGAPGRATSACGLTIYRDSWLGEAYRDNAFTCEPVHQSIHRLILRRVADGYRGERPPEETDREFLISTDQWFRPVQARTGPDGALWIVDMYRYVIEHSRWIPKQTLAELDVLAGQRRGRIYRVVPTTGRTLRTEWGRLNQSSPQQLAELLSSPNGTLRDMCHQQLMWLPDVPDETVNRIADLARSHANPRVRLQALSVLDGIDGGRGETMDRETLMDALADEQNDVVRRAVRIAGTRLGDSELSDAIWEARRRDDLRLRCEVAFAFARSTESNAAKRLAELAVNYPNDERLQLTVKSAVTRDNVDAIVRHVMQADPATRDSKSFSQMLSYCVSIGDSATVAFVLRSALERSESPTDRLRTLSHLLDAADRQAPELSAAQRQTLRPPLAALWRIANDRLEDALDDSADADAVASADLLAAISFLGRRRGACSRQLLPAADQPLWLRISQLLDARLPPEVQLAALRAMADAGDSTGDGATGGAAMLLNRVDRVGAEMQRQVLSALLARPSWTRQLLKSIEAQRFPVSLLDASQRQQLLTHPQPDVQQFAKRVLNSGISADRRAVMQPYREALVELAQQNGRLPAEHVRKGGEIFEKACSKCHRVEGKGYVVGPDLMALSNRDPLTLLQAVLDPNREVDARYVSWIVAQADGRTATGLLVEESSTSITLREPEGKEHVILRSDIAQLRSSQQSLMPEGLEKDLSPVELSYVIAYLSSLRGPFKSFDGNRPEVVREVDGEWRLLASVGEIRGDAIRFERPFQNVGYWHEQGDHVTWRVNIAESGRFDVYLDWSCDAAAAGNPFAIEVGASRIVGRAESTGGWDRYRQELVGRLELAAGTHQLVVRPTAAVRGALFDLREVRLVPAGTATEFERVGNPSTDAPVALPRYPPEIAPFLLDESQTVQRRVEVIDRRPGMGPEVVRRLAATLQESDFGNEEEYRRIPWIWRVAIACGKRNDGGELRDLLEVSLPETNEPLRHWQAVVIGGGIINGLTQVDTWPDRRLAEILDRNPQLRARWEHALKASTQMADDDTVRTGTRYDALRMIAMLPWEDSRTQLTKYLASESRELQMGAISGLGDVRRVEAVELLKQALPQLEERNKRLAEEAIQRLPR